MRRLLLKLRRRARLERDLEDELALHRELAVAQTNHVPLGSAARIKEEARDLWRFVLLEDAWQDLRYGARALIRQPGFTLFAVLALALGIGVNLVVFSVFNYMVLRPWPVRDPAGVVLFEGDLFSRAEFEQIREHTRTFDGLTFTTDTASGIRIDGEPSFWQRVEIVSGNYFDVVSVPMTIGRGFGAWEDQETAPVAVAVLAHSFWRTRFGSDRSVLGQQVRLNDVSFTIVGVAGPGFTGTFDRDVWVPAAARPLVVGQGERIDADERCCRLVGRLAAGTTRAQAQTEILILLRSLRPDETASARPLWLTGTSRIEAPIGLGMVMPFLIAQVAVGAIFLLACLNVANLTLARALARDRELAIRMSLGAGRGRIVRQLLSEGLLLAGAAALAIVSVTPLLLWIAGLSDETAGSSAVDVRVLAYAAGAAVLAALVCGLLPAWQVTRRGLVEATKRQSAQATPHLPLRGVLLGLQVAVSVVVLVCAALLARGVYHASRVDPGFKLDGLSAIRMQVHWEDYFERSVRDFASRLRVALQPLGPVAIADTAPLAPPMRTTVHLATPGSATATTVQVHQVYVDSAWFDLLDIAPVAGRTFVPQDVGRDVVVINETMARRYWPDESPLGRTVRLGVTDVGFPLRPVVPPESRNHEVVGVVRDAHLTGIAEVAPAVFRVHQEKDQTFTLIVPSRMVTTAEKIARQLEPRVAMNSTGLSRLIEDQLAASRYLAWLATGLAALALILAATGVYGVFAHGVESRRKEIGIRIALGARANTVVVTVLRSNTRSLVVGLAAGLILAVLSSQVLVSQLYGVSRLDPIAYAGVLLVLLLAGVAASVLPARRASRIDPVKVLQAE